MKKTYQAFICLMIIISLISIMVWPCYSVGHIYDTLDIDIDTNDIPSETAYIDLLLPISKDDDNFVEFCTDNSVKNIFSDETIILTNQCEISYFDLNGFKSYNLHYKDSIINDHRSSESIVIVSFGKHSNGDFYKFQKYKNIMLAFVDANGRVLKTTETIDIEDSYFMRFSGLSVNNNIVRYNELNVYHIVFAMFAVCAIVIVIIFICYSRAKQLF